MTELVESFGRKLKHSFRGSILRLIVSIAVGKRHCDRTSSALMRKIGVILNARMRDEIKAVS
jgi:hypothetical protein